MDVKETGEVVDLVVGVVQVGGEIANGTPTLSAGLKLLGALQKAPAAVKDAGKIPAELADLDETEKKQLFAKIEALNLPQDEIEVWAERFLKAAIVVGALIADYAATQKTA